MPYAIAGSSENFKKSGYLNLFRHKFEESFYIRFKFNDRLEYKVLHNEAEVLAGISAGDELAFTSLMDHYTPVIYPYLTYWLRMRFWYRNC